MYVEVDILGKITSQFLSYKTSTFRCLDLSRHVGHGDIWRRKWERLEQHRVSIISLQAAVHPEYMLRALITKEEEEHELNMFDNRMLRRILEPTRPEVT